MGLKKETESLDTKIELMEFNLEGAKRKKRYVTMDRRIEWGKLWKNRRHGKIFEERDTEEAIDYADGARLFSFEAECGYRGYERTIR